MRKTVTEKRKVVTTEEIILERSGYCNKCGKEFVQDGEYDNCWDAELHNISISFGYDSRYDLQKWSFDLCEDCLIDLVKTFKFVPEGFMQPTDIHPVEKDHQLVFERWKETGEWEPFTNYTVKEIERFRGLFGNEYLNKLIERCKNGELEYKNRKVI